MGNGRRGLLQTLDCRSLLEGNIIPSALTHIYLPGYPEVKLSMIYLLTRGAAHLPGSPDFYTPFL